MALGDSPPALAFKMTLSVTHATAATEEEAGRRRADVYTPANSAVEQPAGSHSLAAAAHRKRYADGNDLRR